MSKRVSQIFLSFVLILTLTMVNVLFVCANIATYAAELVNMDKSTNHKNVEFVAYLRNEKGESSDKLDTDINSSVVNLCLELKVNQEGYFNGKIDIGSTNFEIRDSNFQNEYINKVEGSTIYLNQIDVGRTLNLEVPIKLLDKEVFDAGLLSAQNEITLTGIYRNRQERDINIEATRDVTLSLFKNDVNKEDIRNELEVITNKVIEVEGVNKRVVQTSLKLGLINNNYPIKNINLEVTVPSSEGKNPEVQTIVNMNSMLSWDSEYKDNKVTIDMKNQSNVNNNIRWAKQGYEEVILTFIYDEEEEIDEFKIEANQVVTLFDGSQVKANELEVNLSDITSLEKTIAVNVINEEESIYKGNLYAGNDRKYTSETQVEFNLANIFDSAVIIEENAVYNTGKLANVVYESSKINKKQVLDILGNDGKLQIISNNQLLAEITKDSEVDGEGNVVIKYNHEVRSIIIRTTEVKNTGKINIIHNKAIKDNGRAELGNITKLNSKVIALYITGDEITNIQEIGSEIELKETVTEARLEINRTTLTTVVRNNLEIKAILKSNEEQYDLYKNPQLAIELPSQVENISINSIDIMYENELKIRNYELNGRILTINLEGEQTSYKELALEGAYIIINMDLELDKKATTSEESIKMAYKNDNATRYLNVESLGYTSKNIDVIAPKDMITIHSIKDLGVETIGEEEALDVTIERGVSAKTVEGQIEIINNNQEKINDVKILGNFATNNENSNMDIEIVKGIELENAVVYYSENENATTDIRDIRNGWSREIEDASKVRSYLISVDEMEPQSSINASYEMEIPQNLEYNQVAETEYTASYTNSVTNIETKLDATTIALQTGVGPVANAKLVATVGGEEVTGAVKTGEVIRYRLQVSNVGTEDISNVKVSGLVPEGTTLVEAEDNYEYIGPVYYKELNDRKYEATIEKLAVGEVAYREYEVRVNNNTSAGTVLTNKQEIRYNDVVKESEEIRHTTSSGDLRVSVKRVTDRGAEIRELGVVSYFAIIENTSNKKLDNVKIATNLQENLRVSQVNLLTGMEDETNVESEILQYEEQIDIGSLEVGEVKVLNYSIVIGKIDVIQFSVKALSSQNEYRSNVWEDKVKQMDVSLSMTTNTNSQYVEAGDIINYVIDVQNNSNSDTSGLIIKSVIPSQLTVNKVTVEGEVIDYTRNAVEISYNIAANGTGKIEIETVVNYSEARLEAEPITTVATAEVFGKEIATTREVTHIIRAFEAFEENDDNEENNGNNNNGNNNNENNNQVEDNDITQGNRTITGIAWFDENADGKKDASERTLAGIKVRLLNTQTNNLVKDTNGNILEATTNSNGIYILDKIGNGKYIAIFDYDTTRYNLTKYQVSEVANNLNSNAMMNEITIENEKSRVASTDIIEIEDTDISNINIGLVELQNFDLELNKYVSRILIQNSAGTTVKEYDNETIAKAEIDSKLINGTTAIIEYSIVVKNAGEVEGYAKKIADYIPSDMRFSSELNKDWYQSGNTLYNTSIGNEKLAAGESREIKLTLTKTMTETNMGLSSNTAEIAEDYNELGLLDSNSTPGNRANGENDMSSAEVILSIKTGGAMYITIAIVTVLTLGVAGFVIYKKKFKKNEIDEI